METHRWAGILRQAHRAEAHETARLSVGMVFSLLASKSSCCCLVRKLCRGRGPCTLASSPTSTNSTLPCCMRSKHEPAQRIADCQTRVVEARPPHTAFSLLLSRQAQLGRACNVQQEEAQGVEARPSPLTCQQAQKGNLACLKGWGARLPLHQQNRPEAEKRREQAGRHAMLSFNLCERARARPSPHKGLCCACSLLTALHPQMRWPFGIKAALATQAVARHPCTPPASATQSVAARSPAPSPATQSVAARPPARAVNVSWLSRSDREMDEQIETALYEPWPRPNSGGRLVEVYSAGFQTMESRAGVHGTRPVERTDQNRGINLVNASDDALVKTAINNILPRMNRNIATPTSLVDARQLQGRRSRARPQEAQRRPLRQSPDVSLGSRLRRDRGRRPSCCSSFCSRRPARQPLEQRHGATSQ